MDFRATNISTFTQVVLDKYIYYVLINRYYKKSLNNKKIVSFKSFNTHYDNTRDL